MAQRNVMQIIQNTRDKIIPGLDMTYTDMTTIYNTSKNDIFGLIAKSFVFGYAQGLKAQKRSKT